MIYGQKGRKMNSMCFDHDPMREEFRGQPGYVKNVIHQLDFMVIT